MGHPTPRLALFLRFLAAQAETIPFQAVATASTRPAHDRRSSTKMPAGQRARGTNGQERAAQHAQHAPPLGPGSAPRSIRSFDLAGQHLRHSDVLECVAAAFGLSITELATRFPIVYRETKRTNDSPDGAPPQDEVGLLLSITEAQTIQPFLDNTRQQRRRTALRRLQSLMRSSTAAVKPARTAGGRASTKPKRLAKTGR